MASIFIYNYNNYYNRKVKKEDALIGYGSPVYTESSANLNFNPNDGVTTAFVAGRVSNSYDGRGDYLIYSEDNTSITSRWFVLEATRARKGQYNLILKRDVIVDNYDAVMNGTALIEKGIVDDSNPLIYNGEPIPVNQIKTKEYELRDDTDAAWIIGYIARNTSYDNGGSTDKNKMTFETSVIIPDITVSSLSAWTYNKYVGKQLARSIPTPFFDFALKDYNFNKKAYRNFSFDNDITNEFVETGKFDNALRVYTFDYFMNWLMTKKSDIEDKTSQYNKLYFPADVSVNQADYDTLSLLQGKIIQAGTDYYKIHIAVKPRETIVDISENKQGQYMYDYLYDLFNSYDSKFIYGHGFYGRYVWNYDTVALSLEPMTYGAYTCMFPDENSRYHLKDAPYDMFAIPYSDTGALQGLKHNKTLALSIAQELSRKLDANLYDMQILPYCPFGGYNIISKGNMLFTNSDAKRTTRVVDDNGITKLYIVWCTASSGTKNIIIPDSIAYTNKKIENQCSMYRLVSPNFNGQFEFNLAKNDTKTLNTFNVDFTYMPYNPYIHITPVPFSGLYGSDFNDARGLICGGDFSLARVNDAWQSYQLQNKNYQAIFDRKIQNMDTNRKYDRYNDVAGAIAGSVQTVMAGVTLGDAVGGAVGGALGLGAGVADIALNESKYQESRSYAQDVHRYQLENVQALPYSLSKTTAFTFNNKIFPILEYYTCTDEEKFAVANEIANTGMTVGVIGQIQDYAFNTWSYKDIVSRNFVKCRLIRLEDVKDDAHTLDAISNELNKGVYFE